MLLLARTLKKRIALIAQMVRLGSLWILSHNTFDQTFMTKGISAARKFHYQNRSFWDLEFLNGNGCKSFIAEEKGQQYQEMLCMRLLSESLAQAIEFLDHRLISLGHGAMPINENGKTHWGNKNYCSSTNVFNTSAIVS